MLKMFIKFTTFSRHGVQNQQVLYRTSCICVGFIIKCINVQHLLTNSVLRQTIKDQTFLKVDIYRYVIFCFQMKNSTKFHLHYFNPKTLATQKILKVIGHSRVKVKGHIEARGRGRFRGSRIPWKQSTCRPLTLTSLRWKACWISGLWI